MDDDKEFIAGFFSFFGWLGYMGPILYALITHQWLWLGLVIAATLGATIHNAVRHAAEEQE